MINWILYNSKQPPEIGKEYLVHCFNGKVYNAVLLNDLSRNKTFWMQGGELIEHVSHYAEVNKPDIKGAFEWFVPEG